MNIRQVFSADLFVDWANAKRTLYDYDETIAATSKTAVLAD